MHPWIFSGAIATLSEEIESGEVVHTHTISKNKTLGEIENFAFDKIDEYVKEEEKR